MLMEKIIKSTLGIKDHRVVTVTGDTNALTIHVDLIAGRKRKCSGCGRRQRVRDRLRERTWRHVPLWNIPVYICYRPARVRCDRCGIKVEKIPWSNGKSCLSYPLTLAIAKWARLLPMSVAGELFGVCWNAVYSAVKQVVQYGIACRDKAETVIVGIDEISRKKGHVYHTQIYDLVYRKLLASLEGREATSVRAFFVEWGKDNLTHIIAICCDMWAPYIQVIKEMLPHALLVFDKFHIVRHLLNAVDKVRKQEAEELKKTNPDLLKKTRYLWLKNPWNLTEKQKQRLSYLERLNLKINRAYILKENFRELWTYTDRKQAKQFLDHWFWLATHSRLKPMRDFAWLLRNHEEGVLAYFDLPIDNGVVEAMNNNAKAVSHRARGYRSPSTFSTLLLHCLGDLEMPPSVHKFA
jgi:transposase